MQLDWITVAAQIINFLIIVWLLNRFLYGPVSRAMERREAEIRGRLDDARDQREKAQARERELLDERAEFEAAREAKLAAVHKEADDLARQLRAQVRADVEARRDAWLAELREDKQAFLVQLRTSISREFREFAGAALGTLVDMPLETRMVDVIIGRLKRLDRDEAQRLAVGARGASGAIEVVSGDKLDTVLQQKLTRAIRDVLGDDLDVRFSPAAPDLIGIRLKGGSMTLEWSLDEFLDRFIDDLSERFPEHADENSAADSEKELIRGNGEAR